MNQQAILEDSVAEQAATSKAPGARSGHHRSVATRIRGAAVSSGVFLWKYLFAMLCTQNPLSSVLLVGWANRFTQRATLKQWWRASELRQSGQSFGAFIASVDETQGHASSPNWIIQNGFWGHLRKARKENIGWLGFLGHALKAGFHSLGQNARIGVQVAFNTWVLTLPGCVFMLFAWEFGWNNSFYKGYEQAQIGPATGIFGILLFLGAMLYVPLATARQAATQNWKSFYDFRFVARLIRRRPFQCLGLAVVFTLVALPVNLLKTAPGFLTGGGGEFAQRVEATTPDEALAFLATYFFWASAVVVPAYVLVRLMAGRVYASALLAEIRYGREMPALAPLERAVLEPLNLLDRRVSQRNLVWRAIGWSASRSGFTIAMVLSLIVWFTFIAQTYVTEFLNYHSEFGIAWLNHPLIQLPFFRYIPAALNQ